MKRPVWRNPKLVNMSVKYTLTYVVNFLLHDEFTEIVGNKVFFSIKCKFCNTMIPLSRPALITVSFIIH